ncbi:MAG: transporter substrate-binding domain-containing protein [Oceanospirillaceae bacterium]
MKYFLCLLICFCLPVQARIITACGHPEYPPVSWQQQGTLTGIASSVAKKLFTELGYQLAIDTSGNWKRCLEEVKSGNIDLIVAAYKTRPRTSFLAYSTEYIVADKVGIFVNKSDTRVYKTLNDLLGKRVGLLLGDSFGDLFDLFLQTLPDREFVSKGAQNLAKLAYQRIDFMPLGSVSGQLQLQKFGYKEKIKISNLSIGTEHFYLAIGQHSKLQKHLPYINQRLAELHQNGSIKRLQECFGQYYLNKQPQGSCDALP